MAWQRVCRKGRLHFFFNFFLDLIILLHYGCVCLLRAVAAAAKIYFLDSLNGKFVATTFLGVHYKEKTLTRFY